MKVAIRDEIWEAVLCYYYPQVGRSTMEKEELYEILDRVVTREKVLIGGDFNCYFGKEACGSGEIHGGHVVG